MRSAGDGRRPLAAALAATVLTFALTAPAPADAASKRGRVCAKRTVVVQSPGGFTVGYLYRRDAVRIVRRSANRRWSRIVTPTDLVGWVSTRSLCRRR